MQSDTGAQCCFGCVFACWCCGCGGVRVCGCGGVHLFVFFALWRWLRAFLSLRRRTCLLCFRAVATVPCVFEAKLAPTGPREIAILGVRFKFQRVFEFPISMFLSIFAILI